MRLAVLGLSLLLASAQPAAAQVQIRQWPAAGGFDIAQTGTACGMTAEFPMPGRSDIKFTLVLDDDGATLGLTSQDWSTEDRRDYPDITYLIGQHAFGGISQGYHSGSEKGFIVYFRPEVLGDFASGDRLFVARGGLVVANLSLTGSAAGIDVLRRCSEFVTSQVRAQAAREARVGYIARDPFAENPQTSDDRSATRPSVITNPTWQRRPGGEFPDGAHERGVDLGTVQLECGANPDGSLSDCEVISESPEGAGFSRAALQGTRQARLTPRSVQGAAAGARVRFTTRFAYN